MPYERLINELATKIAEDKRIPPEKKLALFTKLIDVRTAVIKERTLDG